MKRFFTLLFFVTIFQSANACDICGCSSGNYFIGPFQHFQKHFIGVRHSLRNYFSRMENDPNEYSKDLYQTTEIYGGLHVGKRWELILFAPYNINKQEMETHPHKERGMGDVTMMGNYRAMSTKNNQLLIGGGIKFPTGKFQPGLMHHPVPSANVQPGTGSADFVVNITDIVRENNSTLYVNVNYKINGSKTQFHFGNRLNSIVLFSYFLGKKNVIKPYSGLQFEYIDANQYESIRIDDTGGRALFETTGIDVNFGKVNVGMNVQLPIAQNFSNHQTDAKLRGMLQCSFVF